MRPEVDYYENGGVGLEIHHLEDRDTYWLKAGVGYLQFEEDDLLALSELLDAYHDEEINYDTQGSRTLRIVSGVLFVLFLSALAVILLGA